MSEHWHNSDLVQEENPDRSVEHIMELLNSGMHPDDVAYVLNCSHSLIFNKLSRKGLEIPAVAYVDRRKNADKTKEERLARRRARENEIRALSGQPPVTVVEKPKPPEKRGRGRPKGSKNKKPAIDVKKYDIAHSVVDPKTGMVVYNKGHTSLVIGRMGDERVTQFVAYHMELMKMRQGVDKSDVNDLYRRFWNYLGYCAEHGIVPNNMNAYYAIGISRQDVYAWKHGTHGTPEHKKFAFDITDFFASIHEQGPTDGVLNNISAMFWQKAHDGLVEASKVEVVNDSPLGEKRSAQDIADKYGELLPDDS